MFELIEPYISGIIMAITLAVGGYVINYYRTRKELVEKIRKDQREMKEDVQLIKKTILIFAKRVDKQTMKAHDVDTEFYCLTKDLLTNEILRNKQAV